jgi:hypothetical protein
MGGTAPGDDTGSEHGSDSSVLSMEDSSFLCVPRAGLEGEGGSPGGSFDESVSKEPQSSAAEAALEEEDDYEEDFDEGMEDGEVKEESGIVKMLRHSTYGTFVEIVKRLKLNIKLELPRVVVRPLPPSKDGRPRGSALTDASAMFPPSQNTGDESNGKSSTGERVAMALVFPTNSEFIMRVLHRPRLGQKKTHVGVSVVSRELLHTDAHQAPAQARPAPPREEDHPPQARGPRVSPAGQTRPGPCRILGTDPLVLCVVLRDVSGSDDIAALVEAEMKRRCGDKLVSEEVLEVEIQSAGVPDLELIDLPGSFVRSRCLEVLGLVEG